MFQGCTNLSTIMIGSGCKKIDFQAFTFCNSLKGIYCYADTYPETNQNAFISSNINAAILHVPTDLISTYKSTDPWSGFMDVVSLPYIIYMADGEVYKKDLVMIGTPINPLAAPEKEGYSFDGWSEMPEIMPNHDITVTGTFTINKYRLTYMIDGEEYAYYDITYGTSITPEPSPVKEGYTFSGWNGIPETMPGHDMTISGPFTANKYKLIQVSHVKK